MSSWSDPEVARCQQPRRYTYKFEFRDDDVFTKHTIHIRIKQNGVAVDPQSCHVQHACVFQDADGGSIYSAYLTETDVEYRKNSYHKIQILVPDMVTSNGNVCWLLQTYGGIGAAGYMYNETEMPLKDAKREFQEIFENLTGNQWHNRQNFTKIRGKMNMLDIVYTCNKVDELRESMQLEESVREVLKLMVKSTEPISPLVQIRDSRKWPLGVLSEKHFDEAYTILGQLLDCISLQNKGEADDKTMIRCTNKYYAVMPHISKSDCPRLLNTPASIQDEYEFLDTLPRTLRFTSSLEAHYANLSTKLYPLPSTDPFYKSIAKCVRRGDVQVDEIFRLNRHGEDHRYLPFQSFKNKKLLWHGSPLRNFIPILSQGLVIHGIGKRGTFGSGIYFSDMVAKSIPYCRVYGSSDTTNSGLLLLCEVALGRMDVKVGSTGREVFYGCDSIFGCGQTVPDPKDNMVLENDVVFALGHGIPMTEIPDSGYGTLPDTHATPCLPYNEYVVYEEAQVKMKYLVKFSRLDKN